MACLLVALSLPTLPVGTGTASAQTSGLQVTDLASGVTATDLANDLVGSGGGVSISNVAYTGADRAAGSFTGGDGIIGFDSGIILDSGNVETHPGDAPCSVGVEGPNKCHEQDSSGAAGPDGPSNSTGFGLPGDPDLDALSALNCPNGGCNTEDASVLTFDFVPTFSTVQFKYVFASEEYSDFANTQFNDVFGFFVNGTNCALVPGTTEPVSVNTINNGNDAGGDTTPHNPQFFIDNVNPTPTLNTEMDGLTTVLTCNATVNPGVTNTMKLAVADAGDDALDSAVFIQASSLVSGTAIATSLSGNGTIGTSISVPAGTAVTDTATVSGTNSATATGSVTYNVYSDSSCQTLFASGGTASVVAGVAGSSTPVTLSAAGTYYWQALYSGDAFNNAVTSTCGSETAEVPSSLAAPTLSTTASAAVAIGGTVSDTAVLAGGQSPGGTITFQLFGPDDAQCTSVPAFTATVTVTGNGTYPSGTFTPTTAGSYRFVASYSGDANNAAVASSCGDPAETVTVSAPTTATTSTTTVPPTTTTTVAPTTTTVAPTTTTVAPTTTTVAPTTTTVAPTTSTVAPTTTTVAPTTTTTLPPTTTTTTVPPTTTTTTVPPTTTQRPTTTTTTRRATTSTTRATTTTTRPATAAPTTSSTSSTTTVAPTTATLAPPTTTVSPPSTTSPKPALKLDRASTPPDGPVRVTGVDCVANSPVELMIGVVNVGNTVAGSDGSFSTSLNLNMPVGSYVLTARCGVVLTARISVVLSSHSNPPASAGALLLILLLIIMGSMYLQFTR